jgi:hypothetical protein
MHTSTYQETGGSQNHEILVHQGVSVCVVGRGVIFFTPHLFIVYYASIISICKFHNISIWFDVGGTQVRPLISYITG